MFFALGYFITSVLFEDFSICSTLSHNGLTIKHRNESKNLKHVCQASINALYNFDEFTILTLQTAGKHFTVETLLFLLFRANNSVQPSRQDALHQLSSNYTFHTGVNSHFY